METYVAFFFTVLILAIVPGADFAMVTKNTLGLGKRAGQVTALGIASGLGIHTLAAVLGLSAIIAKSVFLFDCIKYAGAAYLFYLGITLIFTHSRVAKDDGGEAITEDKEFRASRAYFQGLLSNVLNPKASILYLTLLPQFIVPGENVSFKLVVLGVIAIVVVLLWFLFLATALNHIRIWFEKPNIQELFQQVSGGFFIIFGLKLALEEK